MGCWIEFMLYWQLLVCVEDEVDEMLELEEVEDEDELQCCVDGWEGMVKVVEDKMFLCRCMWLFVMGLKLFRRGRCFDEI